VGKTSELPAGERDMLLADLARREFFAKHSPHLQRVPRCGSDAVACRHRPWRGPVHASGEDSIRSLEGHGALIADSHGLRYRIPTPDVSTATVATFLSRYL